MSDQAEEAAPAEIQAEPSVPGAASASATEGSIQTAPLSTAQRDNGKLVGWVASAYGNAKLSARTEKNLRLLEHITADSLTLVFDLLKLLGEVTVSGVKLIHRSITEASASQTPNNPSPPVSSDGGRLRLLSEESANGINQPDGSITELSAPQSPIAPRARVSSDRGSSVVPQPSSAAGAGSSSKKYALAKLMQILERDPDLAHNDPELCRKTHWGIATICAGELEALNIPAAVNTSTDPFSWRDQNIAARARNLCSIGVEYGEKYCLLAGENIEAQVQDNMAALHAMAALVGRVDDDYSKARLHNIKRLEFVRNPDDLSDQVIEGMIEDASRASGKSGVDMLRVFSDLADRKSEWERLTPRLRKILGTD